MTRPCVLRGPKNGQRLEAPMGCNRSTKKAHRHSPKITADLASLKNDSNPHSLYNLLGVPNDASPREITSAYRRRALLCHPDKVRQRTGSGKPNVTEDDLPCPSVEEATKHFQNLQAAYAILNDPKKRERYNRTGEVGTDGLDEKSYEEAYIFYRQMYPEVTEAAIDQFKESYTGSKEEEEDIQDFFIKFDGDLARFFEFIPLSDPSDTKRYMDIIAKLIKAKKIKETPAYKKTIRDFESTALKFKKRSEKEKKQSQNKRKSTTASEDDSSLTLAILGNMSRREASQKRFLEELGKYAKKSKKR